MKLTKLIARLVQTLGEQGDLNLEDDSCLTHGIDDIYSNIREAQDNLSPTITFEKWVQWASENNPWFQLANYLHERPPLFNPTPKSDNVEEVAQEQGQKVVKQKPAPHGDTSDIPLVCFGKLPENKPEDKAGVKDLPKCVTDEIRVDARASARDLVREIWKHSLHIESIAESGAGFDPISCCTWLNKWRAKFQDIFVSLREIEADGIIALPMRQLTDRTPNGQAEMARDD